MHRQRNTTALLRTLVLSLGLLAILLLLLIFYSGVSASGYGVNIRIGQP